MEKEKERKESVAATYLSLNPPIAARPTAAELCDACIEGEFGRARQILLSGVDVNGQIGGCTPAYIVCQNGHPECLSLRINHGAQLNKANNTGATPAFIACYQGHTEKKALLINHGADCSKKTDDGSGPIHVACQNGHFECVKALLDRGKVDVNCTNIHRQTSALICCVEGHVKILHLLIQHGADLSLANTFVKSPAHMASTFGRVKMLALIEKVNANLINQRDNQGATPLLCARESSHDAAVEWLIEHGAEEAGEALEGAKLEMFKDRIEEKTESARLARLASKYRENPDCKADRTAEGFRLKKCSLCMVISYCSEACQHQHWKVHRPLCKEFRS